MDPEQRASTTRLSHDRCRDRRAIALSFLMGARAILVALMLVVVMSIFPGSALGQYGTDSDVAGRRVGDRLAEIRRRLEETSRNSQDLLVLIGESDRRLQEINAILVELEPKVAGARARLGKAQSELDEATSMYLAKVAQVDEAEQRYFLLRQRVAARIARAYKDSSFIEISVILEARSISELGWRRTYLDSVVARDRKDQVELIALRDRLDSERALLEDTKNLLISRRNVVQEQTEEVISLYKANLEARDLAQKELENHRELLSMVLADRAEALRMLDSLEGVSDEAKRELLATASQGSPTVIPGFFVWPADGPLTSGFGPRLHPIAGVVRQHNGIDIGAPYGAPVRAAASGTVIKAGAMGGYGLVVVIDHGNGLSTLYAHQSRILVSPGSSISQGAVVGEVGSTGYSTGPHLHFEVRINGEPVDPMQWFPNKASSG
ncbi:MAG: hypothetical protein C4319_03480 [Acidimicrobiia bacterium]